MPLLVNKYIADKLILKVLSIQLKLNKDQNIENKNDLVFNGKNIYKSMNLRKSLFIEKIKILNCNKFYLVELIDRIL
jgi:hypothetical protein